MPNFVILIRTNEGKLNEVCVLDAQVISVKVADRFLSKSMFESFVIGTEAQPMNKCIGR